MPQRDMVQIREILFPTDLSQASERAFQHARLWAERFRARLVVYHAVEIPTAEYARWGADHDDEIRARYEQRARRELSLRFSASSVPCEAIVQRDVAAPSLLVDVALLDLIGQREPDVVVMATHARRGLARAFLGSVAEQVVHHAGRPVLCVPPVEGLATLPYRRLLVSTDLSEASRPAFTWAALLSKTFDAPVMALHVPPRPTVAALSGLGSDPPAFSAEQVSRFLSPELDGMGVDVRVDAPGRAWDGIVRTADEAGVDLIVISRRGHDGPGHPILGSTTDRVIRHSSCPILVV